MVQPGSFECRSAGLGQAHTGGQQVGVVAQAVGLGNDDFQVIAQQRFTTRQTALHRTQRPALLQHTQPVCGAQLLRL